MTFSVMAAADVPARATRTSKTTPLRNALLALEIGEAIEVSYDSHDPEAGYRPTTISQVAGTMTADSETVKYSVRRKQDGTGCYLIAGPKPDPSEPRRGRKPRPKAEGEDGAADAKPRSTSRAKAAKDDAEACAVEPAV